MIAESILKVSNEQGVLLYVESGKLKFKAKAGALTTDLKERIKENKDAIIAHLEKRSDLDSAGSTMSKIKKTGMKQGELSFAQKRLWFLDKLQGSSPEYNLPMAFNVVGRFNLSKAEQVLNQIIERHEILRTVYLEHSGKSIQVVKDNASFKITLLDSSQKALQDQEEFVRQRLKADAVKPFDLAKDLMLRVTYIQQSKDLGVLLFNMHHIASDGWSMQNLAKEFVTAYYSRSDVASLFPPLKAQYLDYAQWQQEWIESGLVDKQMGYWQAQLNDTPVVHNLPLSKPRSGSSQNIEICIDKQLPAETANKLQRYAMKKGLTPFMLLHAAFAWVLSRHSGVNDIVMGTPVANRLSSELNELIGFFVNTLVLRVNTDFECLDEYLEHVRQTNIDAQSNQHVSFEQIVEKLKVERTPLHAPVFQIMVAMTTDYGQANYDVVSGHSDSVVFEQIEESVSYAKYDLDLDFTLADKGITIRLAYDSGLFEHSYIDRLCSHLANTLTHIVEGEVNQLQSINIFSEQEMERLLSVGDIRENRENNLLLHELIEKAARQYPERLAVVYEDTHLNYRELDVHATKLACSLRDAGLNKGDYVATYLTRSLNMPVSFLAILKAGGVYVPINPTLPDERITSILDEADINFVLAQSSLSKASFLKSRSVIELESGSIIKAPEPSQIYTLNRTVESCDLAYCIFTSGTTGKPKGVMIEHKSIVSLYQGWREVFDLEVGVRSHIQLAEVGFDVSIGDMVRSLCSGGKLVICPKDIQLEAPKLFELMTREQVDIGEFVPASLRLLCDYLEQNKRRFPNLNFLIVGSDAWNVQDHQKVQAVLQERTTLVNSYGLTECAVDSTYYIDEPNQLADYQPNTALIGKPYPNVQLYILDEQKRLQPEGVVGELYVGGDSVARGYFNNSKLTHEKFVENPHVVGERLFKTGDLVRMNVCGNLEYLGRNDDCCKIRGFRVELGEIQQRIETHAVVDSCLVVAEQSENRGPTLFAYIVLIKEHATEQVLLHKEITTDLKSVLPLYMLPQAIVTVDKWPLTHNGKIDKKALPKPDFNLIAESYVAPETEVEHTLVGIWSELLNIDVDKVSTTSNFFDLGGHSLLSIRLVSSIRKCFAVELPIQAVFDATTLADLSLTVTQHQGGIALAPLDIIPRDKECYAVSFSQQRLWFIDQLQGGTPEYNMPMAFEVQGQLNLSLLTEVFTHIIARHEVLRTVYVESQGEATQHIRQMSDIEFAVNEVELAHLTEEAQLSEIKTHVEADIVTPFDLAFDVMVRVSYLHTAKDAGVLIFNMHHIASDGWSMEVLAKEFFTLYEAFSQDQPSPLPELDIQYADYAHWQRTHLEGQVLDKQLDYWTKQLDEVSPVHSLPLSHTRPESKSHLGAVVRGSLSADVSKKLLTLAKHHYLTPFMLLHGAVSLLLSRHSNSSDIVIGTPVANRLQAELEPLIGFFVNTLVLRADTEYESLSAYFAHIREVNLGAQSNQDVPFEQLVERLNTPRSVAHTPLFQIMLTTNTDYGVNYDSKLDTMTLSDVTLSPYQSDTIQAKFDLDIDMSISDEGVGVNWTYDVSVFDEANIQRLNEHLCRLLTELSEVTQEDVKLHSLAVLSAQEEHHLITELNNAKVDYPKEKCVHELFEQQARENPDNVAVVFEDSQLTYKQLNEKANQLAHYLVEQQNVMPETLVGLCVERSLEMVIGILGILKAGGAYLPIDPNYPQARLEYMVEDAQLGVIVSHAQTRDTLNNYTGKIIDLDNKAVYTDCDISNLDKAALGLSSSHLAYVIYTSGSTGNPKGVMVEHTSLYALMTEMSTWFSDAQCVGWCANYVFDASLQGLLYLFLGRKVDLIPDQIKKQPTQLQAYIESHHIELLDCTPSLLQFWIDGCADFTPPHLLIGGEAISKELWQTLCEYEDKGVLARNVYGPTECTVNATYADVVKGPVNIGQTLPYAEAHILNAQNSQILTPKGSIGELYIGGAGLARGYLNRPELTAERFIENPYYDKEDPNSSMRLYRTGDLVRYLQDGNLEFIGRADNQVKIRGFRIELGEVESQLSGQSSVDSALVMTKQVAGSEQLVGYIKPSVELEQDAFGALISELKSSVTSHLPDYMMPSMLMVVAEWPLSPNGKVDIKALPDPDVSSLQGEYDEPETETEHVLVAIWSELLKIEADKISTTANFFDLGGHSLMAVKLVSEIRDQLGVEMLVRAIFEQSTIKELAQSVTMQPEQAKRPKLCAIPRDQASYPLSYAQQRLWVIDRMQGGSSAYNMPMALRIEGHFDEAIAAQALEHIIARHEVLRTVFQEHQGEVSQVIRADVEFVLAKQDVSGLTDTQQAAAIEQYVAEESRRPFDLTQDVMLRAGFIRQHQNAGVLFINMHHIASDGWSMSVLTQEFMAAYGSLAHGDRVSLAPLLLQYVDYAVWQRMWLEEGVLAQQLSYWQTQLADAPALHGLPLDYERPMRKQHQGDVVSHQLSSNVAKLLTQFAKQHGMTPFMLMHGVLSLVLARHSCSHDIVVGTPVANRRESALSPLIGFFVNTLVLRTHTCADTVSEYFAHVKEVNLAAQDNQDVPFETVVEKLKVARDEAANPLFQILLSMNINEKYVAEHQGWRVFPLEENNNVAKFDLDISVELGDQGISIAWTYDTALFKAATISRLSQHLENALCSLVQEQPHLLADIRMLSADELTFLTEQVAGDRKTESHYRLVHEVFEAEVAKATEQPAITCDGRTLTYAELNALANQVAHLLEQRLSAFSKVVGICMERSVETIAAMLGVMKSGRAYVPIDPTTPSERVKYVMEETKVDIVLSQRHLAARLANLGNVQLLCLDEPMLLAGQEASNLRHVKVTPSSLAYVMYTSGSTGKPKGVMIQHESIVNMATQPDFVDFTATEAVLSMATLVFDGSLIDLYYALFNGKHLVMLTEAERLNEGSWLKLSEQHNTSFSFIPTALFHQLVSQGSTVFKNLTQVAIGGEEVKQNILDVYFERYPENIVINGYGPTEVTVFATFEQLTKDNSQASLGKPIVNSQCYVLDHALNLVPLGTIGEMCIGGVGLARGYWNSESLTAQAFVANPYGEGCLYRTGDLVRFNAAGKLEYKGRKDEQVKIRGHRIELSEIEYQLTQVAEVEQATVVVVNEVGAEPYLVGYLTGLGDGQTLSGAASEHIASVLPDYMCPLGYMVLEQLPLTHNGKVDKKALPMYSLYSTDVSEMNELCSPLQKRLASIWREILTVSEDRIHANSDFFALGGNSLSILKLIYQIDRHIGVELDVADVMQNRTISKMELHINSGSNQPWQPLIEMLTKSKRVEKLAVIIPGAGMTPAAYSVLAEQYSWCDMVLGVQPRGLRQGQIPFDDINELLRVLEVTLQTYLVYDLQEVFVVGHSMGGVVGFELACRLEQSGIKVSLELYETLLDPTASIGVNFDEIQTKPTISNDIFDRVESVYNGQLKMLSHYKPSGCFGGSCRMFYGSHSDIWQKHLIDINNTCQKYFNKKIQMLELIGDHYSILDAVIEPAALSDTSSGVRK